jgi:putative transposase
MTFKPQHSREHLYFVTATVLDWIPLFTQPAYDSIVLDSLAWHGDHARWILFAYVLMLHHSDGHHLHALLKPQDPFTISDVLQSFGSFTAHAILDHLQAEQRTAWLHTFAQRKDRDAGKRHQIWQTIQAKNVYAEAFLRQKLAYIYNNPVAKGWRLAEDRTAYAYSSACYYDRGERPRVAVTDVWLWWFGEE